MFRFIRKYFWVGMFFAIWFALMFGARIVGLLRVGDLR